VFIAGILGLNPPQTVARLCPLSLCFGWDNELQKTFFQSIINRQMDRNYSSLSNQKGVNLCLKCIKIRLVAGPTGQKLMHSSRSPSCNGGLGGRREGREEGGDGKGGEGNSPKVKVGRINTASNLLERYY